MIALDVRKRIGPHAMQAHSRARTEWLEPARSHRDQSTRLPSASHTHNCLTSRQTFTLSMRHTSKSAQIVQLRESLTSRRRCGNIASPSIQRRCSQNPPCASQTRNRPRRIASLLPRHHPLQDEAVTERYLEQRGDEHVEQSDVATSCAQLWRAQCRMQMLTRPFRFARYGIPSSDRQRNK
jgi:hypothetical protein